MMRKTWQAIHNAVKHNIDIQGGKGMQYIISEWPWKYLWEIVEKDTAKNTAQKDFETREKSLQTKQWVHGTVHTDTERDANAKSRAKIAVMQELEKKTEKDIAKADTIISDVVSK